MQQSDVLYWPICDYENDVNTILEYIDRYIIRLAEKHFPRSATQGATDMEIDDLAQNIRVKLWLAMQRGKIINVRAYLRSIAYTEAVDIVRRSRLVHPLALDQDGELCHGNILGSSNQKVCDPADELERKETIVECMHKVVDDVLTLPPRQQYAMICVLKDQVSDRLVLVEAFAAHGLDIEAINWPREKDEVQRLRASLSVARAKLRSKRVY